MSDQTEIAFSVWNIKQTIKIKIILKKQYIYNFLYNYFTFIQQYSENFPIHMQNASSQSFLLT